MKSPAYPHQLPIHRQLNQLKQQIPSFWARHGPNHVCPRPWRVQRTNIQHPDMSIIAIVQKKWHEMTILRFPVLPASGTLWTRGRIHWLTMPKNTRKQSSALLRDETGGTVHEYIHESWVETNIFIISYRVSSYRVSSCTNIAMFAKMTVMQKISYLNHLYCTSQNHPSRPKRNHHPIPTTTFQRIFSSGTKRSHGSRNTEWQSSSRRMMSSTV